MIETDKYIFFWGGIFSQWYHSNFLINDIKYCCVEQYLMSEKAKIFHDYVMFKKIMDTENPKLHKKYGRQVKNYNDTEWEKIREDIAITGNYAKFSQNRKLYEYLISTENKILVEASPYDIIWGIGLKETDERCLDETKWRGTNLLGKVLMQVRKDIKGREV